MGEVVTLPAPAAPLDLEGLARQRAEHVQAIRQIDTTLAREMERRANELEDICQAICGTGTNLPSLPPGVIEEARQHGNVLPGFVQRFVKLMGMAQ
jgi:hypothetical protein